MSSAAARRFLAASMFDEETTHLLRELPRGAGHYRYRLGVLLVTGLVHVGAVLAFLLGVHVAAPVAPQHVLMVQLQAPEREKLDMAVPLALMRPTIVTVPQPEVVIQALPRLIAAAPPVAEAAPPALAAPLAQRGQSEGREIFLARLLAQLDRFKQYPPAARKAHIQGVVMLHFVMDENGRVTKAEIQKSSGRPALDNEALALIARAQPLPALPADFPARTLDAVVPIEFSLN